MTSTVTGVTGRSLLDEGLFGRLVERVAGEHGLDRGLAGRVVDQAAVFVAACGTRPGLRPSRLVDVGWHAMVLHTREYAEFCDRVAGRMVHHCPDAPGVVSGGVEASVRAVEAAGFVVDRELWAHPAGCGEVGCGAGRPPV